MNKTRPLAIRIGIAFSLAAATSAFAQGDYFFQAEPGGPGTGWKIYEYVSAGIQFDDALTAATLRTVPSGFTGTSHLVSIADLRENGIVSNQIRGGDSWIGLTDRVGAAPLAFESQGTADNRSLGWAWVDGTPFNFHPWADGEPNDFNGTTGGGEDAGQMRGDGLWNDNTSGFAADGAVAGSGNETGGPNFAYTVEYEPAGGILPTTPYANIRSAAILSFNNSIPGAAITGPAFAVREIRNNGGDSGKISDAVFKALSGQGTITDNSTSITRLDVTDPQNGGNGSGVVKGTATPFLSNTGPGAGEDDNNIITVVKGQVVVPTSGEYTFQIRSDDGFALRIAGQTFTSVNGGGFLDPLDPSTIAFSGGTGDSNTRGVMTLAAGTYNIEFVHYEGGGGAYYEVSTAKGAFTEGHGANWLALGDGSTTKPLLRLAAPALLETLQGTTANLEAVRNAINAADGPTKLITDIAVGGPGGDRGVVGRRTGFPNGILNDNHGSKITGQFVLDDGDGIAGESIQLTIGLFADDSFQLHIDGQDFTAVNDFDGNNTANLLTIGNDTWLNADFGGTGNTDTFGLITLTEGSFNFEAYHRQGGGGAGFEMWAALGDQLSAGFNPSFELISAAAENTGLAVVPEPTMGLMSLLGVALVGLRRRRS